MKIYFDLVFLLNLAIDFLLLLSVSYVLKRNVSIKRILLGSLVGSISIIFLFINPGSLMLFIYKIIISLFMILATFSYNNFKYFINNYIYLYLCSIVLGGGLYLIRDEFSFKSEGLLFINNDFDINLLVLLILTPIILFFYVKQTKKLRNNYSNYYKTEIIYNNKSYFFTAFLDTGNKLKDPYKKRPIILINTDKIDFSYEKSILVPYTTVSGVGILKCIVVDKIIIDNSKIIDSPLIGLAEDKFNIDGVDMILNNESI